MKFEEVLELVKAVSDSKVTSLEYRDGETKIAIKTGVQGTTYLGPVIPQASQEELRETIEIQQPVFTGNIVNSPLVGTFYSAASEDAEAFVKVGDQVKKGQTLAIVEAMKLMNEIESDYDGVIEEILAQNAEGVEYGQPLFVIR